jgi:hypothetical protein
MGQQPLRSLPTTPATPTPTPTTTSTQPPTWQSLHAAEAIPTPVLDSKCALVMRQFDEHDDNNSNNNPSGVVMMKIRIARWYHMHPHDPNGPQG